MKNLCVTLYCTHNTTSRHLIAELQPKYVCYTVLLKMFKSKEMRFDNLCTRNEQHKLNTSKCAKMHALMS